MKYCTNCGGSVPDNNNFCPYCGTAITSAAVGPSSAPNHNTTDSTSGTYHNTAGSTSGTYHNAAGSSSGTNGTQNNVPSYAGENSRMLSIVAYITWIGLIVSFILGDRTDEHLRFHLNQSLVLQLFGLLKYIPLLGGIWAVIVFVLWLIALIGAIQGQRVETPLLGKIKIIK